MIGASPHAAAAPAGGLRPNAFLEALPRGRLAENVMHFVRILRAAGLPVGPAKVLDALAAVEAIGVSHRDDFRAALARCRKLLVVDRLCSYGLVGVMDVL